MEDMNKAEEEWCFFRELGDAITRWSLIEHQLYALATVTLVPKDRGALYAAFTGIENFRSKLAFVDRAIIKTVKDEQLLEQWNQLFNEITSNNTQRNHLAHWQCIFYVQSTKPGRRFALEPTFRKHEPRRTRPEPPSDALCLRQIHKVNKEFDALFGKLTIFALKVAGKPENPLLKSYEQPIRLLTIPALRAQMRKALAIQPRPSVRTRSK